MLHFADLFKAIILGIVEGLTEFIPVSSTAHLLITSHLLEFHAIENDVFEIVIQFGAILAICMIYRQKIFHILQTLHHKESQQFSFNLALAFFPAAILGALFHDVIKAVLFSNLIIAISLIIGGVIMIIVDGKERPSSVKNIDELSPLKALYIGIFQCFAMIPGVSRSGATIIGGLLLKLNRKTATEFSFFLAIPTIFGATIYDLAKNLDVIDFSDIKLLLIGTLSAFISALIVIKWFINFVSHNNFVPFGIYRIIVGTIILLFIV